MITLASVLNIVLNNSRNLVWHADLKISNKKVHNNLKMATNASSDRKCGLKDTFIPRGYNGRELIRGQCLLHFHRGSISTFGAPIPLCLKNELCALAPRASGFTV